jgi:hypothetical protein
MRASHGRTNVIASGLITVVTSSCCLMTARSAHCDWRGPAVAEARVALEKETPPVLKWIGRSTG